MVVVFFIVLSFGAFLLKKFAIVFPSRKPKGSFYFPVPAIEGKGEFCNERGHKFFPPAYYQRYSLIQCILQEKQKYGSSIKKVVDLGCAEIQFFPFVKYLEGVEEYICVDIDEDLLQRFCCRVIPLASDFLQQRTTPLTVQILAGSASEPDIRLANANAIIAIELIEHLFPDTLETLPYNIFGVIQPEIFVVTTPNSEFNIFFTSLNNGFRHDDHKFEWSRQQFTDWANNLITRYPNYGVTFCGIAPGAEGTEYFGYSTQLALFFRKSLDSELSQEFKEIFKVIKHVDYPFESKETKLKTMFKWDVHHFLWDASNTDEFCIDNKILVPLKKILENVTIKFECTEQYLRSILEEEGRKITSLKDGQLAVIIPNYNISSDDSESVQSDLCNIEFEGADSVVSEDWDAEPSGRCMNDFSETMQGFGNDNESLNKCSTSSISSKPSQDPNSAQSYVGSPDQKEVQHLEPEPKCLDQQKCGSSLKDSSDKINYIISNTDCCEDACAKVSKATNKEVNVILLHKCQSLEQINQDKNKSKLFRFSLNMEKNDIINCGNEKEKCSSVVQESKENVVSVSSFSETFGLRLEDSYSKAVDSGYPNSCSQDMDLDLTPEQVDEITTESESSFDGDADEESLSEEDNQVDFGDAGVVHFLDNVENGDVANNNRDGEGNNMEDNRAVGEELEFQQLIAEEEIAVPNMAGPAREHDSEDEVNFLWAVPESSQNPLPQEIGQVTFINSHPHPWSSSISSYSNFDDTLSGVVSFGRSSSQYSNILVVPNDELRFPDWLLNILPDEDEIGGSGDMEEDAIINNDVEDNDENNDNNDIASAHSVEMIIEGDTLGGGDPPSR